MHPTHIDCTPPAQLAFAVAPADSLPALVEAGGGECSSTTAPMRPGIRRLDLLPGTAGWYVALFCTRSPAYGRVSIQLAGKL